MTRDPHTCGSIRFECLNREEPAAPDVLGRVFQELEEKLSRGRIRCPLCAWQPSASSRWACGNSKSPENFDAGCGHVWNTFDTGGVCPGCGHRWQWTACLACGGWSRHEDWYEGAWAPNDDSNGRRRVV
jgi:hypothetical protein